MALTPDASSPGWFKPVFGAGPSTEVTAAFTPPAGSTILCIAAPNATNETSVTFSDNHGSTVDVVEASQVDSGSGAAVFMTAAFIDAVNSSTTITVSATVGGSELLYGIFVFTGAAAAVAQLGAIVTALTASSTSSAVSITPTEIGSAVYGLQVERNLGQGISAISGTTIDIMDSANGCVGFHSTALTSALTAENFGGTGASADRWYTLLVEVLPLPPIAIVSVTSLPDVSSVTSTWTGTVVSGQTLVFVVKDIFEQGGAQGSVSTTGHADVWTSVMDLASSGTYPHAYNVFICNAPTTGAITVVFHTHTTANYNVEGTMYVVTGGPLALDGVASVKANATPPITATSQTPTSLGDLMLVVGGTNNGNNSMTTSTTGWTVDVMSGQHDLFAHFIDTRSSLTATAPIFTWTPGDANGDVAMVMLMQSGGGSPPAVGQKAKAINYNQPAVIRASTW